MTEWFHDYYLFNDNISPDIFVMALSTLGIKHTLCPANFSSFHNARKYTKTGIFPSLQARSGH